MKNKKIKKITSLSQIDPKEHIQSLLILLNKLLTH